jgi:mannose/cellobiose epimerase-like protein (N-acyl-D-glucosamine 2-epimerase family)
MSDRTPDWAGATRRFTDWAVRSALPLWAGPGFNKETGRFEERLTMAGKPILDIPIRLTVQARQVFSYAVAARRGWYNGAREVVEQAYAAMVRDYYRPDGKDGWVYSINHDGSIADPRRDLYLHAFALLAIASYVEVTGRKDALALAVETIAFLDDKMRVRDTGGFVEALPASDPVRRQNPHMHLFECMLALWRVTGDDKYRRRADELFVLFRNHWFQPGPGVLAEYFDRNLRVAPGEAGQIVEPGHHSEWIWLLREYEKATGENVQGYVDALYAHVERHGYDANGIMFDEVLIDGRVRLGTHRTWPATEAIKSNVVEAARGRPGAEKRLLAQIDVLLNRFFATETPGGWIDRLGEDGKPVTDYMPGSTLYHVICALDVLTGASAEAC